MNVDRALRLVAGVVVMVTVALGHFVDANWYFFTAFVGLNLFQMSFTGFCPAAMIFKALGVRESEGGAACRS